MSRAGCDCREQGKRCKHRHRMVVVDYSPRRAGGFRVESDSVWRRTYRDDEFSQRREERRAGRRTGRGDRGRS
jgi:hypothetical protein